MWGKLAQKTSFSSHHPRSALRGRGGRAAHAECAGVALVPAPRLREQGCECFGGEVVKNSICTLAGVAQWIERRPVNQRSLV